MRIPFVRTDAAQFEFGGHRCPRRAAAVSSTDLDPSVCDSGCDEDVCLPIEALALRVPRSASPTYAALAVRHHTASTPTRRYPSLGAREPNAVAEQSATHQPILIETIYANHTDCDACTL